MRSYLICSLHLTDTRGGFTIASLLLELWGWTLDGTLVWTYRERERQDGEGGREAGKVRPILFLLKITR